MLAEVNDVRKDPSPRAPRSDLVVDFGLTLLAAAPWVYPRPSVSIRLGALACCALGAVIARYVTKSLELLAFVVVVSMLARLALTRFE